MLRCITKNMGKSISLLLILCLVVSVVPLSNTRAQTIGQATYYIDPVNGDDTNDGLTSTTPFQTITTARDTIRTINDDMTGDIYVYLREGEYNIDSTITFDERDSGTNGYTVIYQAYNDEKPIISGGQKITNWVLHDASKNIYKASTNSLQFRQLYINGQLATRARTPNKSNTETFGPYYQTQGFNSTSKTFKINKWEIQQWENLNQVEMVVQPHWYHLNLRVDAYTTDSSYAYVSFRSPERDYAFNKDASFYNGNAYHFENAYDFLDAQGEWYHDTTTNTVYYIPCEDEDILTAEVTVPQLEVLLQLAGTANSPLHNIEFNGLTFENTTWMRPSTHGLSATQCTQNIDTNPIALQGAVRVEYAHNIKFERNVFQDLGANGLQFYAGVKDSQIIGNVFHSIAATAINMDTLAIKNPSAPEQCENITISNNYISRIGQQYSNGAGMLLSFVKDMTIEHNEICYGPYIGMQIGNQAGGNIDVGMGNNLIRYNNIHHVMQLHDDGGAIYTLSRQPGTHVFENYVHDIIKSGWAMSWPVAGLYLDNYSEYITVENNVTKNCTRLTYEQTGIGAKNNTWLNNTSSNPSVEANSGLETKYQDIKIGFEPTPTPPAQTPIFSSLKVEAEDMGLMNYQFESANFFSNGIGIKAPAGTTGTAKFIYGGQSGTYDLDITYIKEDDGMADYRLYINNTMVDEWTADFGSGFETAYRTLREINLNTGDEIKIEGVQVNGSHARLDYVELSNSTKVLDHNFNTEPTGSIPTNWVVSGDSGTAMIVEEPSQADKSVQVAKDILANDRMEAYSTFDPISGIVTIEYKAKVENHNWMCTPYIYDSQGNIALSITFNDGEIRVYNGSEMITIQSCNMDTWYNIKVVLNTDTDKFDLYVDGSLKLSSEELRSTVSDISKLNFYIGENITGTLFYDDVKVY